MLVDRSGRVWAMRPDPAAALETAQRRGEGGEGVQAAAGLGEPLEGSEFARIVDGVAVIPVLGMLLRRMSWAFWSYEEIARDLRLAIADARVSAVLLDVDSPGGLAAGCADLAAEIRAARAVKPVAAWSGGLCASAAYMLAGSCESLHLGSGAVIGSVGTVIEYVDLEPMLEAAGARIVRVVARQSPAKRLDPDSEEGRAELQALVDAGAEEFLAALAAGRRLPLAQVRERFGQGLVFEPGEALTRQMADGRATFEEILAELAGRPGALPAAPAAASDEEEPMDWDSITAAGLREHRPELVDEIEAGAIAGREDEAATATAQAVEAERARLLALDELAGRGHDEMIAAAKADGTTTAEQLALKMIRADKAAGADHLAARARAEADTDVPAAAPPQSVQIDASAPIEKRAEAEFAGDAKIRAEFGDLATYTAFRRAEEAGRVRVLKRA